MSVCTAPQARSACITFYLGPPAERRHAYQLSIYPALATPSRIFSAEVYTPTYLTLPHVGKVARHDRDRNEIAPQVATATETSRTLHAA